MADTQASEPGVAVAAATASVSRAPRSVRAGDTLGRYELGDEIGEGGMATVFRARDKELRRDVAVKVLFPHLARRGEIVRRFHREARAAAGLEHANILRIYDVGGGEDDDPPFIVMELIRGRTLLEEIEQRGAILAELAACIGALLADALAAAHAALIVHRDVKPSNVLVAHGGRLLLADFGVARLETENSLITRTGALLGTPAYMSPEQASGDTATARSDLYSLGATLYQLATGSLPYGGSAAKVMSQIATGALVSPVRRRAAVGPDLSRVIERLMQADPNQRPADAMAVAAELRELVTAGGLGDPTEELAAYFADPAGFLKTKTPSVVHAVVTAAERAVADDKLPRAMALADRASALAPEDPAVTALVETVTEGGRTSRRRRLLALGGAGTLVLGAAATVGAMLLGGEATPASHDAALVALADAPIEIDAPSSAEPADAAISEPVPADAMPIDAARLRPRDAAVARRADARADDATPMAMTADATVPRGPATDARVTVPIDAAPRNGTLLVVNDTWCELEIDGEPRGRINPRKELTVPAGRHDITCAQPSGAKWRQQVDVPAGGRRTVTGSLLPPVKVTITTALTLDGQAHARGAVVELKRGRYQVILGGVSGFVDIVRDCRLRLDGGRFVCDP